MAYVFTDSTGQEWRPCVTLDAVRKFEQHSGVGLFEAMFDAILANEEKKSKKSKEFIAPNEILRMCKGIFGKIGDLGAFLYETCVPEKQKRELPLAVFCQRITEKEIHEAMTVALGSLFDFFPDPGQAKGGSGKKSGAPLGPTPGKTSLNWPDEQE